MAEQVDAIEKSVQELEKEITCAICHDHYNEPKVLPCCHYYCKECIYRLALRKGLNEPFSCPECRVDTTLPQGGVDKLKTAFFVNRLKDMCSKLGQVHGKVEAKCEMCSGGKTEAFCRQCAMFICNECTGLHQKLKVFAGHKVTSLDELKEGGAKEIIIKEPPLQMCIEHDEPMKIYCFDCSCLICRDCTINVNDHFGHNHKFKKAAPEMKKNFLQQLNPLKEEKLNLSHTMEEVQSTQAEVKTQGDSVSSIIKSSFKHIHQIVEKREQELLKEVETKIIHKLDHLSVQEKSLSTECAVLQSVIDYVEQCVKHLADDEIMCTHTEIENLIHRAIEEHRKKGRSLELIEEVDIGVDVNCAEDLEQLCQTKARIIQLPIDPTKCTVTGEGVKTAEVNKASDFTVITKLTNGKRTKQTCVVDCHLKSLANDSILKCRVKVTKSHEYLIQYTPTFRGRHELVVKVNGQEIADSPFPVFVFIPPTQLSRPVNVITGVVCPTDIAINSVGEMVITELLGDVVVLDREGKRLRSINRSDYQHFDTLCGVTVDKDDNVYFIDGEVSNIYKSDKNMNNVTIDKTEQEKGGHVGLDAVGDEIMVIEKGNKHIKIYNTELEYVKYNEHSGQFQDITHDDGGNLYVNTADSHIQVLSKDGEFMYSFSCGGNGVNKLCKPWGVCVSGQYVYVTDIDNHSISVFTTEGEYVTSFGEKGSKDGEFNIPCRVCTDMDGFIFVCDFNNNRIQMF